MSSDSVVFGDIRLEVLPTTASIYPCSMRDALNMLGIQMHPDTATAYREWLGLRGGERLSRENVLRLHKMYFFCQQGKGRNFSKRRFLQLEMSDQLLTELTRLNYDPPCIY